MKEARYFFVPNAGQCSELPLDEAMHAMRVLRMKSGDEMFLMDGTGCFYRAEVTIAATHHCYYDIKDKLVQPTQWPGHIHLAIAPTKMQERIEWLLEKATEIGIDEVSFVNTAFTERRILKNVRLEKIVISAMKQSRKAWKPIIHEMQQMKDFLNLPQEGRKFIAHCYEEIPRTYLFDELCKISPAEPTTVLIGPEGDFSVGEVMQAMSAGYESVHLGDSRLRTETAGLSAVMMMQLSKSLNLKLSES